jgi:hypothetical protein
MPSCPRVRCADRECLRQSTQGLRCGGVGDPRVGLPCTLCRQRRTPRHAFFAGCNAARWQGAAAKTLTRCSCPAPAALRSGSRFASFRGCHVSRGRDAGAFRDATRAMARLSLPLKEDVSLSKGHAPYAGAALAPANERVRSTAGTRSTQLIIAVDPLGDRKQDRCNCPPRRDLHWRVVAHSASAPLSLRLSWQPRSAILRVYEGY